MFLLRHSKKKKKVEKLKQNKRKENDPAKQHCGIFSLSVNYTKLTGKEKNSTVIALALNPAWAAVIRLVICTTMGNNTKVCWTAVFVFPPQQHEIFPRCPPAPVLECS